MGDEPKRLLKVGVGVFFESCDMGYYIPRLRLPPLHLLPSHPLSSHPHPFTSLSFYFHLGPLPSHALSPSSIFHPSNLSPFTLTSLRLFPSYPSLLMTSLHTSLTHHILSLSHTHTYHTKPYLFCVVLHSSNGSQPANNESFQTDDVIFGREINYLNGTFNCTYLI